MEVIQRVTEILGSIIEGKGIGVTDITYKREGTRMALRILLDKPGGITLNECGSINNDLSDMLDKGNVISERYILEISSPGLDRPIKERRDFEKSLGKKIRVATYANIEGKNVFIGKLLGISESAIVIEEKNGISTEIPQNKIAKARLEIII